MQNEAITRTILCCDEPEGFGPEVDDDMPTAMVLNVIEEIILDTMHPVWFGRHEGYHGVYTRLHIFFVKLIITPIKRNKYQKILFFSPEFFHRNNARGSRTLLQYHREYAPMSSRGL